MSLWSNPFARDTSSPLRAAISAEREQRGVSGQVSTEETDPHLLALLGLGNLSAGGVTVNQRTAMGSAAVWACVNNISQDVAGLPCPLFEKTPAGIEPVADHPASVLLNLQASPLQNSYHMRQSMMAVVLLRGNCYGLIEWGRKEAPVKIHYKHPDETTVWVSGGRLWYRFEGDPKIYPDYDVLHFKGLSLDGVMGVSVLHYHRETLGRGLASNRSATKFYENGAKATGVLESDQKITEPVAERLRARWATTYSGVENSGKVVVLEEGLKYKSISMPPADAQYIEQSKMTWAEVCAIFRMPPHKTGDLSRSTNNNIEQQSQDYVGDTLMPWLLNFEQEYRLKLLRIAERPTRYFKHNISALMRADATSRAEFYAKMLERGVYSVNEVRALEERNGIGPAGDERFVQVNMMPLSRVNELTDATIAGKSSPATPPPNEQN